MLTDLVHQIEATEGNFPTGRFRAHILNRQPTRSHGRFAAGPTHQFGLRAVG